MCMCRWCMYNSTQTCGISYVYMYPVCMSKFWVGPLYIHTYILMHPVRIYIHTNTHNFVCISVLIHTPIYTYICTWVFWCISTQNTLYTSTAYTWVYLPYTHTCTPCAQRIRVCATLAYPYEIYYVNFQVSAIFFSSLENFGQLAILGLV